MVNSGRCLGGRLEKLVSICCGTTTFPGIRAVFFDKDGTLADVEPYLRALAEGRSRALDQRVPGVGEAMQRAFGVRGDRLDPAGLMAVGTRLENEIAAATYLAAQGIPWFEALAQVAQVFQEADRQLPSRAPQTPPLPGILPLLEHLTRHGVLLGVISADSPSNIQSFFDTYGLDPYFQGYVGAEPSQPTKPDPRLVYRLCDQLGVAPAEVLVVGDGQGDMEMAIAAHTAGAIAALWAWLADPPALTASVQLHDPSQITVIPYP